MDKSKLSDDDKKEVKSLFKLAKEKSVLPKNKTNILNWSMGELNAYIIKQTHGMGLKKKLKFAKSLNKEINELKAIRDNKTLNI